MSRFVYSSVIECVTRYGAESSNSCSVYLDHLHVLAPAQVDPKQGVALGPAVADHRHRRHCPPHEAATVNLRINHQDHFSVQTANLHVGLNYVINCLQGPQGFW